MNNALRDGHPADRYLRNGRRYRYTVQEWNLQGYPYYGALGCVSMPQARETAKGALRRGGPVSAVEIKEGNRVVEVWEARGE